MFWVMSQFSDLFFYKFLVFFHKFFILFLLDWAFVTNLVLLLILILLLLLLILLLLFLLILLLLFLLILLLLLLLMLLLLLLLMLLLLLFYDRLITPNFLLLFFEMEMSPIIHMEPYFFSIQISYFLSCTFKDGLRCSLEEFAKILH